MRRSVAVLAIIVLGVLAFLAITGFRVAQQYQRALVFRFGRYIGIARPGLFWIIPFVETIIKVDMRVLTDGVEQQETMTKDNVPDQGERRHLVSRREARPRHHRSAERPQRRRSRSRSRRCATSSASTRSTTC